MPPADRSQTERIRRLRAQGQAVRREECLTCPELGPFSPTDQSTSLSRRFGQMTYYRQTATGANEVLSCCTPTTTNNCKNIRVACDGSLITGLIQDKCYTITNTGSSDLFVVLYSGNFNVYISIPVGSTSGVIVGIDALAPTPCDFLYECKLITEALCGSSGLADDCIKNSESNKTISLTVTGSTSGEILIPLSPGLLVYGIPVGSTYSVAAC